ncbi:retrovirus-related pol polyprotein from transposon TNT 1-94, partial [Tanacetum coccineum]
MHDKKPDLSFLHVFGSLCYPTNDNEDLGKLNAKADIGIFVGYAPAKKDFRIYNRRTRKIMETIHVTFDELTAMASKQIGSGPELQLIPPATTSSGLVPNPIPQQPCKPLYRDDWDRLFQPMFDEYFNPSTNAVSPVPVAAAPRAVDTTESPVSTSIDQDGTILQKSQENGQSRTNTDTGTELSVQKPGECYHGQQALYTRNCGCSKGNLEDKILVPKPPQNCTTCGDSVDGLYCRPCAFVRKRLNE